MWFQSLLMPLPSLFLHMLRVFWLNFWHGSSFSQFVLVFPGWGGSVRGGKGAELILATHYFGGKLVGIKGFSEFCWVAKPWPNRGQNAILAT